LRLFTVVIACSPFAGADTYLPQQYHRPLQVARVSLAKLHQCITEWAGC